MKKFWCKLSSLLYRLPAKDRCSFLLIYFHSFLCIASLTHLSLCLTDTFSLPLDTMHLGGGFHALLIFALFPVSSMDNSVVSTEKKKKEED